MTEEDYERMFIKISTKNGWTYAELAALLDQEIALPTASLSSYESTRMLFHQKAISYDLDNPFEWDLENLSPIQHLKLFILSYCDKLVLLLIFSAGVYYVDMLSFPYLVATMVLLFSEVPLPSSVSYLRRVWKYIHVYNYVYFALNIIFQFPYITSTDEMWEQVLGLNKFKTTYSYLDPETVKTYHEVGAFSTEGVFHSFLIFILVDIQLKLMDTPVYQLFLKINQDEQTQARLRSYHRVLMSRSSRSLVVEYLEWCKKLVVVKLMGIFSEDKKMQFVDEELWIKPPNEEVVNSKSIRSQSISLAPTAKRELLMKQIQPSERLKKEYRNEMEVVLALYGGSIESEQQESDRKETLLDEEEPSRNIDNPAGSQLESIIKKHETDETEVQRDPDPSERISELQEKSFDKEPLMNPDYILRKELNKKKKVQLEESKREEKEHAAEKIQQAKEKRQLFDTHVKKYDPIEDFEAVPKLWVDENGVIVQIDRNFYNLTKISRKQIIGSKFFNLLEQRYENTAEILKNNTYDADKYFEMKNAPPVVKEEEEKASGASRMFYQQAQDMLYMEHCYMEDLLDVKMRLRNNFVGGFGMLTCNYYCRSSKTDVPMPIIRRGTTIQQQSEEKKDGQLSKAEKMKQRRYRCIVLIPPRSWFTITASYMTYFGELLYNFLVCHFIENSDMSLLIRSKKGIVAKDEEEEKSVHQRERSGTADFRLARQTLQGTGLETEFFADNYFVEYDPDKLFNSVLPKDENLNIELPDPDFVFEYFDTAGYEPEAVEDSNHATRKKKKIEHYKYFPYSKTELKAQEIAYQKEDALRHKLKLDSSLISLFNLYVYSNTTYLVYIIFFFNMLINASFLAFVPFFLILGFSSFYQPVPPKLFWRFLLMYVQLVIAVKFLFQLPIFCVIPGPGNSTFYVFGPNDNCIDPNNFSPKDLAFSPDRMIGIYQVANSFAANCFWWVLALLALSIHRSACKTKGIWDENSERLGEMIRLAFSNSEIELLEKSGIYGDHLRLNWFELQHHEKANKRLRRLRENKKQIAHHDLLATASEMTYGEKIYSYIPLSLRKWLFNVNPLDSRGDTITSIKPGIDLYSLTFALELFAAYMIVIFFSRMTLPIDVNEDGISDAIATSRLSGKMVLFLFMQVFIMVMERVAYLNKSIILKLVLQIFTLLYFNVLIFFIWPVSSQRGFLYNGTTIVFFIEKVLYWVVSAIQIRQGYPYFDPFQNRLTRKANTWYGYAFKTYRSLPFVFELRTLLDWVCIPTTLDLWETLKLEDIFAQLYTVKADMEYRKYLKRGELQPFVSGKLLSGSCVFLLLMVVILGPLLLFSTANPATSLNPVLSASVSMYIAGMNGTSRLPLFSISATSSISTVTNDQYQNLQALGLARQDDQQDSCQNVDMVSQADDIWIVSPGSKNDLINSLMDPDQNNVHFEFHYSFTRKGPATTPTVVGCQACTNYQNFLMDYKIREQIAQMLNHSSSVNSVNLKANLFPHYLSLPASGEVLPRNNSEYYKTAEERHIFNPLKGDVYTLELKQEGQTPYFKLYNVTDGTPHGVQFVTISNTIVDSDFLMAIGGYDIITLYLTVVLAIGRFLRMMVADMTQRIVFEDMIHVNTLLQICQGIYLSRTRRDFDNEEMLYRKIIRIYRDPELLLKLTKRIDADEETELEDQ